MRLKKELKCFREGNRLSKCKACPYEFPCWSGTKFNPIWARRHPNKGRWETLMDPLEISI